MKELYQVNRKKDNQLLMEYLSDQGQMLLPLIDLFEGSRRAVEGMINRLSREVIEALLCLSAQSLAGAKQQGKRHGEVYWHGFQDGCVTLSERKLKVKKPRLRKKGCGRGGEVSIPAYSMLNREGMGSRVEELLMSRVSSREYHRVVPEIAGTIGISKSSVSREFVAASAKSMQSLMERRFDHVRFLAIYIDGLYFGSHSVIAAVGVDDAGYKHVLGLTGGATENSESAKSLLEDLVSRGIDPGLRYLFVIDGGKALRKAIDQVFGEQQLIQRCRVHKLRNVLSKLPKELWDQTRSVIKAGWRLSCKEGIPRMRKHAQWLEREYPNAARSLLEGLEETFTINRLELPVSLRRSLGSTNLIESNYSGVRRRTNRVCNWKSGDMAQRWCASALLETEKHFRRIQGYKDLWILKSCLEERRELTDIEKVA